VSALFGVVSCAAAAPSEAKVRTGAVDPAPHQRPLLLIRRFVPPPECPHPHWRSALSDGCSHNSTVIEKETFLRHLDIDCAFYVDLILSYIGPTSDASCVLEAVYWNQILRDEQQRVSIVFPVFVVFLRFALNPFTQKSLIYLQHAVIIAAQTKREQVSCFEHLGIFI
jgi:hypothetical protein